jgi:hypothetical protein
VLRIGGRIFLLLVGITLVAAGFSLGLATAINLGFGVLAGCGGHVPCSVLLAFLLIGVLIGGAGIWLIRLLGK